MRELGQYGKADSPYKTRMGETRFLFYCGEVVGFMEQSIG